MPTAWCNYTFPAGLLNWSHHDFAQVDWEEDNDGRRYDSHPGKKWRGETHPWRDTLPPVAAQFTRRPHNKKRMEEMAQPTMHHSKAKPAVIAQFCSRPVNFKHLYRMAEPKPLAAYQEPRMEPRHKYYPSKTYLQWLRTAGETRLAFRGSMSEDPAAHVRRFLSNQFGSVSKGWEALGATLETKMYHEVFVKALAALGFDREAAQSACKVLVPKQREYDYVMLADLDPQAARVAYAKQQEDAEAGVNSVPHMPHGTDPHKDDPPLIQLREALLAQFPDLKTAWDEFVDPDGDGGVTKAQLLQVVRALGLAGPNKGIDGNVKAFVRNIWLVKDSEDEFFIFEDLEAPRSDAASYDGKTTNYAHSVLATSVSEPSSPTSSMDKTPGKKKSPEKKRSPNKKSPGKGMLGQSGSLPTIPSERRADV
jgi:hypothetical protein